jgi:hypothetical protein
MFWSFHSPFTLSTSKNIRREGYGGPKLGEKSFQLFLLIYYSVDDIFEQMENLF